MVFDTLRNSDLYAGLGPRFAKSFEYLKSSALAGLPAGKHEIDGETIYVVMQEYTTKLEEHAKWEAHRKYIDIQYVIEGRERMGYAPLGRMNTGEYVPEKDFLPMTGEGSYLTLEAGDFTIFFPEDAHMPGVALGEPSLVKKAVVKIAVE